MPDDMTPPAPDAAPALKKRRRSRYVSTLVMGAAALALTACGEDVQETDARIFPTVEACMADFPEAECKQAFEASRQIHIQDAPRFQSQAECEAELGASACQQVAAPTASGGVGSFWMPALMGFMVARALQPGYPGYGFNYGGRGYYPRPVYVDRDGFFRSGGSTVGRIPGGRDAFTTSRTGTSLRTPVTRSGEIGRPSTTAQRGGFGRTASRFGGGGS